MALTGSTNEQKIWNYLKSKGLNDYACAGIMGNLYCESGLNPHNLQNTGNKKLSMTDDEYVIAVDNGTYTKEQFINDGYGAFLAQWTYHTRKKALYEYAKASNKSIGDLEIQLNFLYKELSESYKSVLNTLKTATSVLQASNVVLMEFEKPANQSAAVQTKRANYGRKYYDKYAKSPSTTSSNKVVNSVSIGKMKYNANNKPLICMQTTNACYKSTIQMEVKGVLWHSTGANNPWLKRYVQPSDNASDREKMLDLLGVNTNKNDWNHSNRQAGMNCWIGKLADGTVTTVQTMPWNYRPWGCGKGSKGSCNSGFIQFEICEDSLGDVNYFNQVYKEACEITAYLCTMYNLDPYGTTTVNGVKVPVILCHADSHKLGLGNNHGDIYTWFNKYGKDMDDVRNDVAKLMNKVVASSPLSSSASINISNNKESSFSYRVKITADVLNIRKGAGTNYDTNGTVRKNGVYTIVAEANGEGATKWGLLKSKAGWISLDYVKKI